MKILVTGGAGFIGSHLCKALLDGGDEVLCIDNFDLFYPKEMKMANLQGILKLPRFKFIEMDVRDLALKKILRQEGIETIVHMAARPGVRPSVSDPYVYEDINVKGTLNALEAAAAGNVSNFVFISSSSVYGNCKVTPWKETYEPLPASPYGASKLAGEAYVRTYSELYGLNASCLRYFSVYGASQRPDLAIAKFSDAILKDREITVYGDGSAKRDYTYVSDAVDGTVLAVKKRFGFEAFNIGNSNPIGLLELIKILEQNFGREARVRHAPEEKGDLKNTYADISKAEKLLGYRPKVGIAEGIKKYAEWKMGAGG